MSVRLKITFLFTTIVFCILGLAFSSIYFFSLERREKYIQSRLKSISITTGNLLSRAEFFNRDVISKIDSLTSISFTRKTIQVFDKVNKKVYAFNDDDRDVINSSIDQINAARQNKEIYISVDERDVVFYHYQRNQMDVVVVVAGYDLIGKQNLKSLFYILVFTFISGVIVAFTGGYFFSRQLIKPLRKIADDVNEISAHDAGKRIGIGTSPDEWNYLANSLNKLLDRLQESFEIQRRFISNASHELFTPLTSISSQLEISLQKERKADEYKAVLESIKQDTKQLSKLTLTLLEIAKASGSRGGIEIKPLRIDELLIKLSAEIDKTYKGYSAFLDFNKMPENAEDLIVFGNEELLFTAIKNIVLNACKYSNDQKANISLHSDEDGIAIDVMNWGDGIPSSEFENIFIPFYRIEKNRSGTGFGLGLSLAKRIIKLHDGKIMVSSEVQGKTVFTIQLKRSLNTEGKSKARNIQGEI